jgi:hypothetical protein
MEFGEKLMQMFSKGMHEIGQEFDRSVVQGAAEIGSALFTGNGYVPYGQGQNRDGGVHGMEGLHSNGKEEMQHENDGRSM